MKKIIVTGAGGFIGRKIVFELSKNLISKFKKNIRFVKISEIINDYLNEK